MKRSKKLKIVLMLLSIVAVISCKKQDEIQVYDKRVCADLGKAGAHCQHTFIDKPEDIEKEEWDRIRIGQFCMDSQGLTDTETVVDIVCSKYLKCDYKSRERFRAFIEEMENAT